MIQNVAIDLDFPVSLLGYIAFHYGLLFSIAVIAYLIGAILTNNFRYINSLEKFAISIALGLGVGSLIVFILGAACLLFQASLIILALIVILLSQSVWKNWHRELYSRMLRMRGLRIRDFVARMLILSTLIAAIHPFILLPLYPPTAWDSTSYHLPIAQLYTKYHCLVVAEYLRYPVFPQLGEMLFALSLSFYDAVSAQMTQFLMLVILLAGCVAFCDRFFSRRIGLLAAAMILSYPLVIWSASIACIDATLMTYVFFAIYALEVSILERERKWFILCGVFAGLAAGTKYTALFFAMTICLLILIDAFQRRDSRGLILYGSSFMVVASPSYIRNILISGNPIWPFLSDVFGFWLWNQNDLNAQMLDLAHAHVYSRSLIDFLSLPWNLVANIHLFHHEATLSLVFLGLPLAFAGIKLATCRRLMFVSISFLCMWFFTTQIPRYLLPTLPIFSVLMAWGVDRLLFHIEKHNKNFLAHRLILLLFIILLILPGWIYTNESINRLGPLPVTSQQEEDFLSSHLPTYNAYAFLNIEKESDYDLYALYDENMAFFAEGVFMGDHFGLARYSDLLSSDIDGKVLYERLRSLEADHLLVNLLRTPIRFPLSRDKWFEEHFVLIFADAHVLLYELTEESVKLLSSSELLINPGFEELENDLPIGWGVAGIPMLESSFPLTGKSAVRCLGASNVFFQRVPVEESNLYVLRESVRSDVLGQTARLQVNWLDEEGVFIGTSIRVIDAHTEWEQYEMWITAPIGAVQAQVYASPHEGSQIYFDDLSFVQVKYDH